VETALGIRHFFFRRAGRTFFGRGLPGRGLGQAGGKEEANLEKQVHGDQQQDHRQHIGRAEHRGGHGADQKGIAATVAERFHLEDADACQHDDENGDLECQTEGQGKFDDQREIVADLGHGGNVAAGEAHEKLECGGKNQEIGKEHSANKQENRGENQREKGPPFVFIESWRNEGPKLVKHDGQCQDKAR